MLNLIRGLVLSLLIAASPALAGQMPLLGAGKPTAAGAAFTGPGDVVAGAIAFWGLRAYSAAKRGTNAINVCNALDATCVDMVTDATTGDLVVTTVGGTNCSVSTCTIKIMYDQTAGLQCGHTVTGTSCDVTQTTIANRPVLKVNCVGGKACADNTGIGGTGALVMASGIAPQAPQPFVTSSVFNYINNTDGQLYADTLGTQLRFNASALGHAALYAGSTFSPDIVVSQSTFHALQSTYNAASSEMYLDGSGTTGSPGTGGFSGDVFGVMGRGDQALPMVGYMSELGMWTSTFSAGAKTSMNSNQHTYWGF